MFQADSPLVTHVIPSPNCGERVGCTRPDLIVLHYTGMESAEAARAWHAGVSCWAGETDINSHSVGIEIANPGHDFGYPDFPESQIDAVLALCRDILARHAVSADRVVGHSDIAP